MLQNIRKGLEGTVAKVIVGVIVVTFALFGVESIVGGLSGEPSVAEVNGEGIPESTFKNAVERQKRQMLAQLGEYADPDLIDDALLSASVLDDLVKTEVLYQNADEKGVYVSDAMLNAMIAEEESFKVDGKFSNERLQLLLRSAGLTVKDYKESLNKNFMINQPRGAIVTSAFLMDEERDRIVRLDRQERTFGAAIVKAADYHDKIAISDENVEAHYKENKAQYPKPESVDVSYVELNRSAFASAVKADEASLLKLYESEKANYEAEEQRDASHILIKVTEQRSEPDALKLINEIADKARGGTDFAELAKEFSEDDSSASNGGNLGMSAKGVYVDEFEEALYGLQVSQMSAPVKTELGYHLIKLMAIGRDDVPAFEVMRPSLEQRYIEEEVAKKYAEAVERLSDVGYSANDLSEPSKVLSLEVKTLVDVSRDSSDAIFSNPKVQKILFSSDLVNKGDNSQVIEVESGRSIMFRIDAYHEAGIYSLAAVRERIRTELIERKAKDFATSVGQAFFARISAGDAPELVSKEMGISWARHNNVRRDNHSVDQELLKRVFAMSSADGDSVVTESFVLPAGDVAIVQLEAVNRQENSIVTSIEKNTITNMLGRSLGSVDYGSYEKASLRDARVEKL